MEVAAVGARSYNVGKMPKVRTKVKALSFRLTDFADRLLEKCAEVGGVSKASVLETAIREYAKKRGVTLVEVEAPKEGE